MNLRAISSFSVTAWLSLMPVAVLGYTEPLPPPELGDQLTSYRTNNQKLGPASVNRRYSSVRPKKEDTPDISLDRRPMKEVSVDYSYVPNKSVAVYTKGETIINFFDRNTGRPLDVVKVEVSNRGFLARSENSTVVVIPTGYNTSAKIKVTVNREKTRPLVFELNYLRFRQELRNIENVSI